MKTHRIRKPHSCITDMDMDKILSHFMDAGRFVDDSEAANDYSLCFIRLVKALGVPLTLMELCQRLPVQRRAMTLTECLNAMAEIGYVYREIHSRTNVLSEAVFPCLLAPNDNHSNVAQGPSVILQQEEHVSQEKRIVYSSLDKKDVMFHVDEALIGKLFYFVPQEVRDSLGESQNVEKANSDGCISWNMRWYFNRFKKLLFPSCFAALMIQVLSVATPIFLMCIFDLVNGHYSRDLLVTLSVGWMLAIGAEYSLRSFREKQLLWMSARIHRLMSLDTFSRLLANETQGDKECDPNNSNTSHHLMIFHKLEALKKGMMSSKWMVLFDIPCSLILLIPIAMISTELVWIPIITLVFWGIVSVIAVQSTRSYPSEFQRLNVQKDEMTCNFMDQIHEFRLAGIDKAWIKIFKELLIAMRSKFLKCKNSVVLYEVSTDWMINIALMVMVYSLVPLIGASTLTLGEGVAVLILTGCMLKPLTAAVSLLPQWWQCASLIEELKTLIIPFAHYHSKENLNMKVHRTTPDISGWIQFKSVNFSYKSQSARKLFNQLTFEVKPKESIGIYGKTGSGKSTVSKLLLSMCRPDDGDLY